MGNYISYEELTARYPLLKDFAKQDKTTVDSYIIVLAESDLDSRLAVGFSTPFSDTPPVVKDLVFDLCYVKMIFPSNKKKAEEMLSYIENRIDGILNGSIILADANGDTLESTSDNVWTNVEDWHPTHSMLDAESEYTMISSERLSYEEDERD